MTTHTTTDMISINDYIAIGHRYRYRQAVAYAQVLACTSPRVDTDGSIICESVAGAMVVRPDSLQLDIRLFYNADNPYSLRQELSMLRLVDRFGILPPNDMLYVSVSNHTERLFICDNRIYGASFYVTACDRTACISDILVHCTVCRCRYRMKTSTRTIYRILAKQLREQVARLV